MPWAQFLARASEKESQTKCLLLECRTLPNCDSGRSCEDLISLLPETVFPLHRFSVAAEDWLQMRSGLPQRAASVERLLRGSGPLSRIRFLPQKPSLPIH